MSCFDTVPLSNCDRLLRVVAYAVGVAPVLRESLRSVPLAEPELVHRALTDCLGDTRMVVVTGTLDRRLVLIEGESAAEWTAADLSGQAHSSRSWPRWTHGHLTIAEPSAWLSRAEITPEGMRRLLRPRLLLTSLYHPEYFPLPRFPLAISDLARAARATLLGAVALMDMQLGVLLEDIIGRASSGEVDILGISATFGQHDLLAHLLDAVTSLDKPPLLVVGGSLTARNEHVLLERYPGLLIARGAGEPTIADVLAHWHGDLETDQIRGVGYRGAPRGEGALGIGRRRRTATVANRFQTDIWPELDLLDTTLRYQGVAQLEVSRGCTNFCSFCPRDHKGQWAGTDLAALPWILREMRAVLDQHPHLSRTLYLVDEEFIGRGEDAVRRALTVADTLAAAGFAWETSCRVDQVVRLDCSRAWHTDRAQLWRGLVERGLRRCLFGVESGVNSVLERFNKETSGVQNALAIRTLTALGVPPRFTYITFDHLMTESELCATYAFQGRMDLLLRPVPGMSADEIVDGVRDERWVAEHSTGHPFYTGISYMLVSMECLIGAAYTRKVQAAGLAGRIDPSMGRIEAKYADWRISVLSRWAQLWTDRNFALDYTLKSLEKILDGRPYHLVRGVRRILKDAAYQLFGGMLGLLGQTDRLVGHEEELTGQCATLVEVLIGELQAELAPAVAGLQRSLPADHQQLLQREYTLWRNMTAWQLINADDPCGT